MRVRPLFWSNSVSKPAIVNLPARGVVLAFLYLVFALPGAAPAWAADIPFGSDLSIEALEFHDQPLAEVVRSFGAVAGLSLIPDETLDGTVSWYFPKGSFNEALAVFLAENRLSITKNAGIWEVSRVRVIAEAGLVRELDAENVPLNAALGVLSRKLGFTLSGERLPDTRVTVHGFSGTAAELLSTLLSFTPEYTAADRDTYWHIARVSLSGQAAGPSYPELRVESSAGLWSLRVTTRSFSDVVAEVARKAGFEYSLLMGTNPVIHNLSITGRSLEEVLSILCAQGGADFARRDGMWYFVELSERDVVKGLKETRVIPLTCVSANDAIALLPPDWLSGNLFKTDQKNNAFVLNGTHGDIENFARFIAEIDRPIPGRAWVRFDLKNQRVKAVVPKLPAGYGQAEAVILEDQNSFLLPLPENAVDRVRSLLAEIDRAVPVQTVELKYLNAEELMKRLPPSVQKEELVEAGGARLFFVGPEQRFRQVTEDIRKIDVPSPQIRYQVLVVEYRAGESLTVDGSVSGSNSGGRNGLGLSGTLGGVLDLNVDVVSAFGATFAAALSGKLTDERARVLADTTLQGLSGQDVKFQNTSTYRFTETKIDDETGKEISTGVVHEITSGLIIALNGWVSGDGMITLSMNTTISKRGGEGAADAKTTTERILSTRVRTPSGTPLVVGGLVQRSDERTRTGVPFLSALPLVGRLFGGARTATEDSELTVYVIPFVEYGLKDGDERSRLVSLRLAANGETLRKTAREKWGDLTGKAE